MTAVIRESALNLLAGVIVVLVMLVIMAAQIILSIGRAVAVAWRHLNREGQSCQQHASKWSRSAHSAADAQSPISLRRRHLW